MTEPPSPGLTESSLEKVVPERDFADLLQARGGVLCRLANSLLAAGRESWAKRDYFQLYTEADELESFLDDYGARYNQTYTYLTEMIASMRSFSLAGLSVEHLYRRFEGYRLVDSLPKAEHNAVIADIRRARAFVLLALRVLLKGLKNEVESLGLAYPQESFADGDGEEEVVRFRLPRNVDQEDIVDEALRIAEVATKYIQACEMLAEAGVRKHSDPIARADFLRKRCSEEHARVYEATVHNLQSAYDTYIKNTVLESEDERLVLLRGHISSTLHFLEAVTQLTHFVERHESGMRSEAAERRLGQLVPRGEVQEVVVNCLLYWADRLMQLGRPVAEALLPSYTNVQVLEVEPVEGVTLHARPASLVVAIVNHYGTPVEMEVEGQRCNAGSILELMILVGSHPDSRRYQFRGDENPLRDIKLLFEHKLGEDGVKDLPADLDYLRG